MVVAHAPHAASTDSASDFWAAAERDICAAGTRTSTVILVDANGHLGSECTDAVGPVGQETENEPGRCFHSLLLRHSLFLPSTFPSCHIGESPTWFSSGGVPHQLDYIALPAQWKASAVSCVWTEFEALQARKDHCPVYASCTLLHAHREDAYVGAPARRALRPGPGSSPDDLQVFSYLSKHMPAVPWHVDVDAHFSSWVQGLSALWRDCVRPTVPVPHRTYLSEDTFVLVQWRQDLRRYLREEHGEACRQLLLVGFAALLLSARGLAFGPGSFQLLSRWSSALDHSVAIAVDQLRQSTAAIRCAVRRDRTAYLDSLTHQVCLSDLRDPRRLYQAVRRAFPSSRPAKRQVLSPLPKVLDESGLPAVSPAARAACWRRHFAEQEAGFEVLPAAYPDVFAAQATYGQLRTVPFSIHAIPHLLEVEQIVLSQQRRKACGPDAITAELLQLSSKTSARQLLPILAKATLGLREPVAFRGGHLFCLAKTACVNFACSSFRSILLASIPGKVFHKTIRARLTGPLARFASPLQAGSQPGISTDGISTTTRLFQELELGRARYPAVIYFDLRAAYYRMLRQILWFRFRSRRRASCAYCTPCSCRMMRCGSSWDIFSLCPSSSSPRSHRMSLPLCPIFFAALGSGLIEMLPSLLPLVVPAQGTLLQTFCSPSRSQRT